MNGGCHCGRVTITVPKRPDEMNLCNCTVCTKLGTLWGYYPVAEVQVRGETSIYTRADMKDPALDIHFCEGCGATTSWTARHPGFETTGVNMRLFEPAELDGVTVRYGDRRNYDIGPRRIYRDPTIFDHKRPVA